MRSRPPIRFRPFVLGGAIIVAAACSGTDASAPADTAVPATTAVPPATATAATATAATSTTSPPATTTATTAAPTVYDFSEVSPIVETFVAEQGLNGAGLVVVHRDDGVVHEAHWGEFGPDRISLIASSSKMITAGVLLHLDDQGTLDVDAPVALIADWGAGNPDVTPAQLLSNSSGLVGLLPNPAYGPYLCQYIATGSLQDCAATIFTTPDDDADVIAPDTEFRYGGAQWQVAGAVAEVASGMSWAELSAEIYTQPCDLDVLAYNNHFTQIGAGGFAYPVPFNSDPSTLEPTDNPNMEGGAYVTTGDYAKLLLMHLRGGFCGDTQVLSQDALDRMHGDRIAEVYAGDASPERGYGMGWWIGRDNDRIEDAGAYGSVPWLDLDDGYGAFLVIEADSPTGAILAGQLYDVIESAMAEAHST